MRTNDQLGRLARHSIGSAILFAMLGACAEEDRASTCFSVIAFEGWGTAEISVSENERLMLQFLLSLSQLHEDTIREGYAPPFAVGNSIYVEHDCSVVPVLPDYPPELQRTRLVMKREYRGVVGPDYGHR
ncbi:MULTISPECIES: hypothetical protein [Hyphobacterium]|uniref:Lipoprotein n=1 Tax=Hyphobacterium vulgare TaxID=1736751 RepID=A0ABV6ZST8_9PROT